MTATHFFCIQLQIASNERRRIFHETLCVIVPLFRFIPALSYEVLFVKRLVLRITAPSAIICEMPLLSQLIELLARGKKLLEYLQLIVFIVRQRLPEGRSWKRWWPGCWGSERILPVLLLVLAACKSSRVGNTVPMIISCNPNCPLQVFVVATKQTLEEERRTDSMIDVWKKLN